MGNQAKNNQVIKEMRKEHGAKERRRKKRKGKERPNERRGLRSSGK